MIIPEGDEFADGSESGQRERADRFLPKTVQDNLRKLRKRTRVPIPGDPKGSLRSLGISRILGKNPEEIDHPPARQARGLSRFAQGISSFFKK